MPNPTGRTDVVMGQGGGSVSRVWWLELRVWGGLGLATWGSQAQAGLAPNKHHLTTWYIVSRSLEEKSCQLSGRWEVVVQ